MYYFAFDGISEILPRRNCCKSTRSLRMKAIQEWLGHSTFEVTIPVPNSNTKTHAVPTDSIIQINLIPQSLIDKNVKIALILRC